MMVAFCGWSSEAARGHQLRMVGDIRRAAELGRVGEIPGEARLRRQLLEATDSVAPRAEMAKEGCGGEDSIFGGGSGGAREGQQGLWPLPT